MTDREAFLAGDRPDDVLIFLADDVIGTPEALADIGARVESGVVITAPGTQGRQALQGAVGVDPMAFAREAMNADGEIGADCTRGTCPAATEGGHHDVRFVFAFAEAQNEEAGGLYAEGDVIHAYARCECGQAYTDKWIANGTT